MSSYGVLSTGFNPKLIGDILDDIEARQKADFGAQINTGGESILGQLNATYGASVAENWEILNAVYRSLYPDSATGEALDNVCAITGVTRLPATHSTINLACTGVSGTILLAGRVVSVDATGERFVSTANATMTGSPVSVPFESENFGPIALSTGQALTIETPVPGWTTVAATEDATLGRNLETDAELRLRRVTLLRFQGSGTIEAIRADVLLVADVIQCYVFENVSMVTDSRGVPAKSIEVLVDGGTDVAVAQAIFDTKPAGIGTYGHAPDDVTETITDSMGIDHDISFTRPDTIPIHIEVELDYDPAVYTPATGDQAVKDALALLGDSLSLGDTVIYERFQAEVFSVAGVIDCPVFKIDTVDPPTGTSNITFEIRELATFDTGDIDVTSTSI